MKDMTSEEIAYLAGCVDCDGSIHINKMKHPERDYYSLIVAFAQTSVECIEWISERVEKSASTYITPAGKPYMRVALHGVKAQELLRLVQPYIVGKVEEVDLALEYPAKERGYPPDADEIEEQRSLYEELKALHAS